MGVWILAVYTRKWSRGQYLPVIYAEITASHLKHYLFIEENINFFTHNTMDCLAH